MSCFLCVAISGESPVWYDKILDRNADAFIIPAVGSIAVGHVLVSPEQHINVAHGLNETKKSYFIELLLKTCQRLRDEVGDITVFEHGAPADPNSRRSACIDHAHVHVVPGSYDLRQEPDLQDPTGLGSLEEFYSQPAPYDGYLMFTNPDGSVVTARDIAQSQYLRQRVFEKRGQPEAWDYTLFPNEAAMRGTIALFEPH